MAAMASWTRPGKLTVAALVGAFLLFALRLWDPAPLQALRLKAFDVLQQVHPRPKSSAPVAIVDIDDESLAALGQWPWPRTLIADLVDRIGAAGAIAIGFDVVFAEPDRTSPEQIAAYLRDLDPETRSRLSAMRSHDAAFAEAIARGNVVLGQSAAPRADQGAVDVKARKAAIAARGANPRPHLLSFAGMVRNVPVLETAAAGLGMMTNLPERDGVMRLVPTLLRVGDELFPTLSLELLRLAKKQSTVVVVSNETGVERLVVGDVGIPADRTGRTWLHFNRHDRDRYVSAKDVLAGRVPDGRLANHIVLVGASAIGLFDIKATPVEEAMPGVEINAQWLESALDRTLLERPYHIVLTEYAAAGLLCLFLALTVPRAGAWITLILGGVGVAALGGAAWYLYLEQRILMDVAYPVAAGVLLYAILVYANYLREEQRRAFVRNAFSQYLSPDLVARIAEDPGQLKLSGETRELTFLFTDLAGFTSFVENTEPEALVELLNVYLDGVCRIVMDHGGTVDKIVGDAVHAMYGAPTEMEDHAVRAVASARAIDTFARRFREDRMAAGQPIGVTRIGVNTGTVAVGNFGGASRFDYTAHGDAINTAARLEGANKYLGTLVCISESTMAQCPDSPVRPIGVLMLQGRSTGLATFEPLSDDASPEATRAYCEAYEGMKQGDPSAQKVFRKLTDSMPDDPLCALHARRLADGETGDVVVMAGK